MLRRKVFDELLKWKNREGHKCLILKGQRQIGKTFIIKELAKTYDSSIYIDFSKNRSAMSYFDQDLDVDKIIMSLKINSLESKIEPKKTLIIFDEIQLCPRAKASLKHFTIDGRYDVVASGSLLDVPLPNRDPTALVPVGYVEEMKMYSMDFEEFLWAKGYPEDIITHIRECISNRKPLIPAVLDKVEMSFREFMIVGGMPEAVSSFINGNDIEEVIKIQNDIINECREDMVKYSISTETVKIRKCFDSLPTQLSETNKKFTYSRIEGDKSRAGARKYYNALMWIVDSGVGNPCYQLFEISHPVSIAADEDNFKMYVSDTGLLVRMTDMSKMGTPTAASILTGDTRYNQGAVTENIVAECLRKCGFECCYYFNRKGPRRMELDFVLNLGLEVAAIEVKSGKSREAASLKKTIGDDRFQRRIMLEKSNISVDDSGVEHYPIFAAAFTDEMVTDDGSKIILNSMERRYTGPTMDELKGLSQ